MPIMDSVNINRVEGKGALRWVMGGVQGAAGQQRGDCLYPYHGVTAGLPVFLFCTKRKAVATGCLWFAAFEASGVHVFSRCWRKEC